MVRSYRLSPSQHDKVYTEVIEPAYFARSSPVDKPAAIIVGGQPGAGKSRVIARSIRELNKNVVVVNTDDLRAYHPNFEEITLLDDKVSAGRTHEDASAWNQKLLSRSMETRRNIVLEGVLKDSGKLTSNIKNLKDNGYRVVIRFLAVHERYSLFGIHKRYEGEKENGNHGRFVPLAYHQECYQRILDSAVAVESQKLADRIEVVNREADCLFSNEVDGNEWKFAPGARDAMEQERNKIPRHEQCTEYQKSWYGLFESMKDRKATDEELKGVTKLASVLIEECTRLAAAIMPDRQES